MYYKLWNTLIILNKNEKSMKMYNIWLKDEEEVTDYYANRLLEWSVIKLVSHNNIFSAKHV